MKQIFNLLPNQVYRIKSEIPVTTIEISIVRFETQKEYDHVMNGANYVKYTHHRKKYVASVINNMFKSPGFKIRDKTIFYINHNVDVVSSSSPVQLSRYQKTRVKSHQNILYISSNTMIGGAEKSLLRLLKELDRDSFTPTILILNGEKGVLDSEYAETCNLIYRDMNDDELITFINQGNFDIVHIIIYQKLWDTIIRLSRNIDVFITVFMKAASLVPYFNKHPEIVKRAVWTTDSEMNRVSCPWMNVITIGVDTELYVPKSKNKCSIACVSRIGALKRLDLILEIAKRLPNYSFDIVCAVNTEADEKNYPGLPKLSNVTYHKNLPDKEIAEILGRAEFFISASVTESLSVTMMEAMSCGCIPICTAVGDVPNTIIDGVTGYIIPNKLTPTRSDADGINADEIKGIVTWIVKSIDNFKTEGVGENARKYAARYWNMKAQVKSMEFLYGGIRRNEARIASINSYPLHDNNYWYKKRDSIVFAEMQLKQDFQMITLVPCPYPNIKIMKRIVNGVNIIFYPKSNALNNVMAILDWFRPQVNIMHTIGMLNKTIITQYPNAFNVLYEYGGTLNDAVLCRADCLFVQQEFRKAECKLLPNDKMVTNPFCIDAIRFKPMPGLEKRWNAVMVSDFRKGIKRQELLIKAWESVPGRLLLLGRLNQHEPYRSYEIYCRALCKSLGIADRVDFIDYRPHWELPRILNQCKIGVLTSSREGGSRAQLEKLACGLPMIVMSDCKGAYEFMHKNEGLVVNPNPNAIAAGINKLLNNERLRISMGNNASKRVRAECDYPVMYNKFKDMIEEVVPEISIITTSLNKGKFIEDCIKSVDMQRKVTKINHVVIDAGSTDETHKILKKYANKIDYFINPEQSQTESLNWAMKIINKKYPSTKYIGWINADDKYLNNWLSVSLNAINTKSKKFDMTCAQYQLIDDHGNIKTALQDGGLAFDDVMTFNQLSTGNTVCQPTVLIRKSSFDKLHDKYNFYWNPEYEYCQDYELWRRMLQPGIDYKILRIRKVLACLRHYNEQMSHIHEKEQTLDWKKIQEGMGYQHLYCPECGALASRNKRGATKEQMLKDQKTLKGDKMCIKCGAVW